MALGRARCLVSAGIHTAQMCAYQWPWAHHGAPRWRRPGHASRALARTCCPSVFAPWATATLGAGAPAAGARGSRACAPPRPRPWRGRAASWRPCPAASPAPGGASRALRRWATCVSFWSGVLLLPLASSLPWEHNNLPSRVLDRYPVPQPASSTVNPLTSPAEAMASLRCQPNYPRPVPSRSLTTLERRTTSRSARRD
jgi:hypothetical protein